MKVRVGALAAAISNALAAVSLASSWLRVTSVAGSGVRGYKFALVNTSVIVHPYHMAEHTLLMICVLCHGSSISLMISILSLIPHADAEVV